jgi:Tfp pilus assembly protein PilE
VSGCDRCGGFTRVEVAAVVVIIAVLMVFVLPAIQARRVASRRLVCENNLYQLAFAAQRHVDHHGFLPGWRNAGPAAGGFSSWPIVLLPFLERNDIYKTIGQGNPAPAVFVSSFSCPSSPPAGLAPAMLAYAGNCGSGSNLRRADGVMLDTTVASGTASGRLALADIAAKDGTSVTLLFSEKCGPGTATVPLVQATWNDALPLQAGESIPGFSDGARMYGVFGITGTPAATQRIINSVSAAAPGFFSQPSSNHPGGAIVARCDGQTAFLSQNISARVYCQLLSWDDDACRAERSLYATYGTWTTGDGTLPESDTR